MNIPLVIGISMLFTALFSGIEIAYLTANKLRIELQRKQGLWYTRLLAPFIRQPSLFFTTTLVGNNIAIVVYSIFAAEFIAAFISGRQLIGAEHGNLIFLTQTVLSSIFLLIFGEFIPKALFRTAPNTLLNIFAAPFWVFYILLWVLVMPVMLLSQFILRFFLKTDASAQVQEFTRNDLFHYVEASNARQNEDNEVDKEIFKNAIEFHSLKVRECMIPRTEIEGIEVTDSIEHAIKIFIETGHSKLLVYRENMDHIIGYIHLVDLYRDPAGIDQIVIPIINATGAMPASELMKQLIAKRRSIAVVLDEFGGTAGMITIEDIIEQIIGEIEDEHDVDDSVEKKINDNEYIFSARLEIDHLNDKYRLDLPEGDYETLGGLIFFVYQNIPETNDVIRYEHMEFTILGMDQTRIGEVRLRLLEEE